MSRFRPRRIGHPAIAALLLAAAACASNEPQVGVAFDPLTPFPKTATYDWNERENKLPKDPRVQALDLDPVIKDSFASVMAERGWNLATSANPHYQVSYELGINTWYGSEGSRSYGTLSITMVEAASHRRVWTGFGRAEVEIGLTPEHRAERFRKFFRELLKKFPPSQQH